MPKKHDDTDPKTPVVGPTQPFDPDATQPLPSPEPDTVEPSPDAKVAAFAQSVEGLVNHADEQAQGEGEYQDRWAWWRNHLDEFLREVKQHVKD